MNNDELFEKFIDKQLNKEERTLFDEKCANDTEFAERVNNALYIIALTRANAKIEEEEQKNASISSKSIPFNYRTYAVAASVILLCLVGWWWFQREPDTTALAKEFYKNPKRSLEQPQDIPIVEDSLLLYKLAQQDTAFVAFEKSNYERVTATLTAIKPLKPTDDKSYFYLALSYYETQQYTASIAELDSLYQQTPNITFRFAAKWYQALAYLQVNEVDKAKENLKYLIDNQKDNLYYETAKSLLQQLP